jgi:limonene 1,2-monooxygenase
MAPPVRFGCFMSPLHPVGSDPNLLLRRDLDLATLVDDLNYDELWIGEHHSAGWGTIVVPELFLATAAERTRRIKLATGVMGLPYHHPFMVAERAVMLDHLTRGRFILGVGAGSVVSDMHMLGVRSVDSRRRTAESLETVTELLRGEVVSRTSDWYTLVDGRLQLRPFTPGGPEVTVASAATPFGMQLAGRLGTSVLSHAGPPWGVVRPGRGVGPEKLADQWQHLERAAEEAGHPAPDRRMWRLVLPMHIADTRQQALDDVIDGWLRQRADLWAETMGMPLSGSGISARRAFEATVDGGGMIVGDVDDAVQAIQKLNEICGGFGCLLVSITDWASFDRTRHSLDLFARYVVPCFTGSADSLRASQAWAAANRDEFQKAQFAGRDKAIAEARRASQPGPGAAGEAAGE